MGEEVIGGIIMDGRVDIEEHFSNQELLFRQAELFYRGACSNDKYDAMFKMAAFLRHRKWYRPHMLKVQDVKKSRTKQHAVNVYIGSARDENDHLIILVDIPIDALYYLGKPIYKAYLNEQADKYMRLYRMMNRENINEHEREIMYLRDRLQRLEEDYEADDGN